MDDYAFRYPTLVDDIATVCRFIAEKRITDSSFKGIWHWSGTEVMTKYAMVCQMAEIFGLSHKFQILMLLVLELQGPATLLLVARIWNP